MRRPSASAKKSATFARDTPLPMRTGWSTALLDGPHALEGWRVGAAGARDDDGVGAAALGEVGGGVLDGHVEERRRVLDVDVAQDGHVAVERAAQARQLRGTALDDALVGHVGADDDVAADEVGAHDRRDREGLEARVAQEVDTDREVGRLAHGPHDDGHGGHGDGRHRLAEEGRVADVLDDHGIHAGALEEGSLRQRVFDDLVQAQLAAGRAGQRRQVDHAEERPAAQQLGHRHP